MECNLCRTPFSTQKQNQIYCSVKCQSLAANRRFNAKRRAKNLAAGLRSDGKDWAPKRQVNPEKLKARKRRENRSSIERIGFIINKIKSQPCQDCGRSFHPVCMDFDHREPDKKHKEISRMRSSWRGLIRELAKCDLVCANCHRLRTRLQYFDL